MEIRSTTDQDLTVFVDTVHAAFGRFPETPTQGGGGTAPSTLVRAGHIRAHHRGAAALADALFRAERSPHSMGVRSGPVEDRDTRRFAGRSLTQMIVYSGMTRKTG